MFYYVKGTVTHIEQNLAVIDCAGVGYACITSQNTLASLKFGEQTTLYTYLHVREDIFDLYGFYDLEECSCFKLLLSISGVGPKAAVAILSALTPQKLALAVVSEDEKALTAAQGIGKKLAQRILLELKDKMEKEQLGTKSSGIITKNDEMPAGEDKKIMEALEALAVLGYSKSEAMRVFAKLDAKTLSLEEMVRLALKSLVR
ncbi:MAG: Holliday junction branch migration protein RuvA [Clostridiales bacterium]|nr:Holliday junction branch migration protein RuvA [Clostridiales bacterium]